MPKFNAHGTTLEIGSVAIGGLESMGLPDQSKGEAETTDSDSAFDREFVPGLRDNGNLQVNCRLMVEDPGQDAVRANFDADAQIDTFTITLPSAAASGGTATYTFSGYISSLGGDLPMAADEAAMFTFSIRVTGAVTKAVA